MLFKPLVRARGGGDTWRFCILVSCATFPSEYIKNKITFLGSGVLSVYPSYRQWNGPDGLLSSPLNLWLLNSWSEYQRANFIPIVSRGFLKSGLLFLSRYCLSCINLFVSGWAEFLRYWREKKCSSNRFKCFPDLLVVIDIIHFNELEVFEELSVTTCGATL